MATTYTVTYTGGLTPSGALSKQIEKAVELAGEVTPTSALVTGRDLSMGGELAPSGILVKSITKALAAGLTPVGALTRSLEALFTGGLTPAGRLLTGRDETACNVTVAAFKTRLGQLLDDPTHIYYTEAEILHALNVGQRLWGLITLCFERTASLTLTNGQDYYEVSSQIDDYLLPLRVSLSGTRLKCDTLNNLDLRNRAWRATPGTPLRYAREGFDKLWITPQPASGGPYVLDFIYAAMPDVLILDTDVPEIPGDNSASLQDFAFWWLRFKEGGQEAQNANLYLKRFLDAAGKYASFVRAKNRAQGYDNWPPELTLYDRSRFEVKLARQRAWDQMNKESDKEKPNA